MRASIVSDAMCAAPRQHRTAAVVCSILAAAPFFAAACSPATSAPRPPPPPVAPLAEARPFLSRSARVEEGATHVAWFDVAAGLVPTIVVAGPGNARADRAAAAETLRDVLEKITGVRATIVEANDASKPARAIVVDDGVDADLSSADGHGFAIDGRSDASSTTVTLHGASGVALRYAAWFFLMRYLDVRVVLPGALGLVHPTRSRIELPSSIHVVNPAPDFRLRYWSGPGGLDPIAWLADAPQTQRFDYHHNLANIYPPEKYGATHPEYYPLAGGKTVVPTSSAAWQPRFGEPAVAARAIAYADDFFSAHPDKLSLSLSVNDGLGYSQDDVAAGKVLGDGTVSISDVYYAYVNRVARAVREKWPGRYVAIVPYDLTAAPPSFPLEDNVVVFVLNEPIVGRAAWSAKAKHFGAYQWLYGVTWIFPNHWPHALQDYLRGLHDAGGVAFKGEAYPAWALDGPKMWVLANLLWNVDADVDALLRDYYVHAFGAEAAPAVARFFARAEAVYARRRTDDRFHLADAFRPGVRQFADVRDDDVAVMRAALDEAAKVVRGADNAARLALLSTAFGWAESYLAQRSALARIAEMHPSNAADVASSLAAVRAYFDGREAPAAYLEKKISACPQTCAYSGVSDAVDRAVIDPAVAWPDADAILSDAFARMGKALGGEGNPEGAGKILVASESDARLVPFVESERLRLSAPNAVLKNLLDDGSFEEAPKKPDDVALDWAGYHNREVDAEVARDLAAAHDGGASLHVRGITDYSGVIRKVRFQTGRRYRLSYWFRGSANSRAFCELNFPKLPLREDVVAPAQWTKHEVAFTVDRTDAASIDVFLVLGLHRGWTKDAQVWFDDVHLEMLSPDGVAAP